MTNDEAGNLYLSVVCKSNLAGKKMATTVQTEPFVLEASKTDTAQYRDAIKSVIEQLRTPVKPFPSDVQADIDAFVEGLFSEMSEAAALAASSNEQGFIAAWNAWTDPAKANPAHVASQKIRLKLGLSADAHGSCGL